MDVLDEEIIGIITKFTEINVKSNDCVRLMDSYPIIQRNYEQFYQEEARSQNEQFQAVARLMQSEFKKVEISQRLQKTMPKHLSRALETQREYLSRIESQIDKMIK
jgi:hypothetical protein